MIPPKFPVLFDVDDTLASNSAAYHRRGESVSLPESELSPLKTGALELGVFFNRNPHLAFVFWTSVQVHSQLDYGKALGLDEFYVTGNTNEGFFCVLNSIAKDDTRLKAFISVPKTNSLKKMFIDLENTNFLWVEDSLGDVDYKFMQKNELMNRCLGVGTMEPIVGSITEWKENMNINWRTHSGMFPYDKPLLPRLKERLTELGVEFIEA